MFFSEFFKRHIIFRILFYLKVNQRTKKTKRQKVRR